MGLVLYDYKNDYKIIIKKNICYIKKKITFFDLDEM